MNDRILSVEEMVGDIRAVLTLWYVRTDKPGTILASEPKADRGFGRKFLAQINPKWPITLIGQFPLNRSAPASPDEFYVAGFPGITCVQLQYNGSAKLSEIDPMWLHSVPARADNIYAFAVDEKSGFGGFAHWHKGELKRSLCAHREMLHEDLGLPEGFEADYWAGLTTEQLGGIALPFSPPDIVAAAQREWLETDIGPDGPDINVVAYAVDGRPEPKFDETPAKKEPASVTELTRAAAGKLGLGPEYSAYDDYEHRVNAEDTSPTATAEELGKFARQGLRVARLLGRDARIWAARGAKTLKDKLRHTDRP